MDDMNTVPVVLISFYHPDYKLVRNELRAELKTASPGSKRIILFVMCKGLLSC